MSRRVCRLCLASPSVCYSLLEDNLSEMLEALTSIKVDSTDVSPISCLKCLLNMKLAFNIQQKFLRSDEKLKEFAILNNVEVKLEVEEELLLEMNSINVGAETDSCPSSCIVCGNKVDEKLLAKHIQQHFDKYKSHIHVNHPQTSHKCLHCGASFRYKSLYNVHLSQAHKTCRKRPKREASLGPFTCKECEKQFTCKRKFNSHTHRRKKCPICGAQITISNFRKHTLNHSSGPQICELCGATLSNLESLRGHLTYTHSSQIFNCDKCGKVFHKRYTYQLHLKKHAGEKSHVCETCGKAFFTMYYLNKHVKTAHLKLRPYICQFCKKAFSSRFALRTHERQHTNETPYKCEVCGEGFRQNVSLRAHRKSKHNIIEPKNCACPVCGKLFGSEQAILSHMRLH
ncbi:zinc finger protein 112 isoform X2 [Tribolium castaneum]|uniref:zinc finger protein 112 isoform X2 n=1 Tax=Tribolium castaneum TaxID=7070 RepID=UPI00046C08F4|nr:PREDICTED: zinc finger protein 112 isoform X2 [Tribolium castaneum]|eukprot:XP_008192073.1 PREDICTED: zinc finger protein 112 isoform X2 [Tribolium castaneum]